MRRPLLLAAALLVAAPAAGAAQPHVLVGGGISSPTSSFSDAAASGYHARLAVAVGIPTLPVAIRLDGDYHRFGAASASLEGPTVTSGALDVVFTLPGVGLEPYLFGGVGRHRVSSGPKGMAAVRIDEGFDMGFGLALGAIGFGGFVEIRYVKIGGGSDVTMIPLTFGLRL